MEWGNFFLGGEEEATHCKVWVHFAVICAKTAEPIEMSFGLWTRISPRNYVLDGVQIHPWEGAILTEKGQTIVKYRDALP